MSPRIAKREPDPANGIGQTETAHTPDSSPTVRFDKVERARRALNEHDYDAEDVLDQTVRRIVEALTHPPETP